MGIGGFVAKARVFLVDDSADIRKAVRRLFHAHPRFEVVGEAARTLPPQGHQHTTAQGEIRWRMIAYANHEPQ